MIKIGIQAILSFSLVVTLKSCVPSQPVQVLQRTTSIEIEKDYYFGLLNEKITDGITRTTGLNSPVLEVILGSVGHPQNSEFFIIQLVFFGDSVYLYERQKDKRFDHMSLRTKEVKADSLLKSVEKYFSGYHENHIQKFLTKEDSRNKSYRDLRGIIIRKNNVDNVVFFAVNGTKYGKGDILPDSSLYEVLKLMQRNRAKYLDIPTE
jgi:hypothetical protein